MKTTASEAVGYRSSRVWAESGRGGLVKARGQSVSPCEGARLEDRDGKKGGGPTTRRQKGEDGLRAKMIRIRGLGR